MDFQSSGNAAKEVLVQAIDKNGLTKNEVARLTGLTPTTVIRIYRGEAGQLHPNTVVRIAKAFGYRAVFKEDDLVAMRPQHQVGSSRLSPRQKEEILQEVNKAVREILSKF